MSKVLHFWVKGVWISEEMGFALAGSDIRLGRKHDNYLPGVEPLRPSALDERVCVAGLRVLRAATRATERERLHKGR